MSVVGGIMSAIMYFTRSTIKKSAEVTWSLAKAVKDDLSRLGPWAVPLAKFISSIIKIGAKGLYWLSQNLLVVAIAILLFLLNYVNAKKR